MKNQANLNNVQFSVEIIKDEYNQYYVYISLENGNSCKYRLGDDITVGQIIDNYLKLYF